MSSRDATATYDKRVAQALAEEASNGQPNGTGALHFRALADVEMRSIEWLDKPLFQRAAFHLVAGKKGAGKGTYLAGVAARASQGELFDHPVDVLLAATEDSDEIDLKPRIVAAGGDPNRIHSLVGGMTLPRDVPKLRKAAQSYENAGVIILDPIASHVRGDTHAEDPVRAAIDPLNDLANELDCLLIGVRHLSKNTQAGALASILGSAAWINVPRAVLVVAADNEHDLLFHIAVAAGNRSARGAGRVFQIELVDVGLKEPITKATELGESDKDLDFLLDDEQNRERKRKPSPKKDAAKELILRELQDGPRSMEYLKAKGASLGISDAGNTVWKAANDLKADEIVTSKNSGPGTPWLWSLTFSSDFPHSQPLQSHDFDSKVKTLSYLSPPAREAKVKKDDISWADLQDALFEMSKRTGHHGHSLADAIDFIKQGDAWEPPTPSTQRESTNYSAPTTNADSSSSSETQRSGPDIPGAQTSRSSPISPSSPSAGRENDVQLADEISKQEPLPSSTEITTAASASPVHTSTSSDDIQLPDDIPLP